MTEETSVEDAVLTKAMLEEELDKRILKVVAEALNGTLPSQGEGHDTLADARFYLQSEVDRTIRDRLQNSLHISVTY